MCFGLAQPCVERVIAHIIAWISYGCHRFRTRQASGDQQPLLSTANSTSGPSINAPSNRQHSRTCYGLRVRDIVAKILSGLVLLASIAYAFSGQYVTTLPSERMALSGSKKCGLWRLRADANDAAQDADSLIRGEKETTAGLYARSCYGRQPDTGLDQCTIFAEPSIDFDMQTGQECPFVNSTYCASTGYTAVRLSTGMLNAKRIGLNAKRSPKLRRTTVCVPLNLEAGFAEKLSSVSGHWGYNLGPVSSDRYSSNYTFIQPADPFYYDVRAYTARRVMISLSL